MYKKLASATAIYALVPQIPKLVSFFMLPVLTPHLTSYDYGIIGIIFAYLGMADALKDLGLSLIYTNSFYKYPNRYKFIWRRIFGFLSVYGIVFGLLLAPVLWAILPESEENKIFILAALVLIPTMFFAPVSQVGILYFQLNQRPKSFVTISVTCSLIAIFVNYTTIVDWEMGYIGLLAGQFAANLLSFLIYALLIIYKVKIYPSFQFSLKWIKAKIWLCAPMIPHFYSAYLLNISDRVILDLFKVDIGKIGVYAFGYTIGTYFSIIGKGMGTAAIPLMMEEYNKGTIEAETKIRNMVWLMQGTLLVVGILLCFWVKELFTFIARNESLRGSYSYAIPVIMAYTFYPMYYGSNTKLRFHEKTNSIWKVTFTAGLVSIGLNLLLIPLIGISGAAITTFLAYLFMGYRGYWLREFRDNNFVNYKPIFWLCASLIAIILVYLVADVNWSIKLILSLCLASIPLLYRAKIKEIIK